jgi:peptide-methionine (S)-S-oxide reductase
METATLANGCFWCTEAIFQMVKGVEGVQSGYSGGTVENPTYAEVSDGDTGHAESLQIVFDPKVVSFKDILFIFFRTHNPTTLNQQGADIGSQYRSAIFYHNEEQKRQAEEAKKEAQSLYNDPIVTEITEFTNFYPAERYHQNYYKEHGNAPYCKFVIDPKVQKMRKEFAKFLNAS